MGGEVVVVVLEMVPKEFLKKDQKEKGAGVRIGVKG